MDSTRLAIRYDEDGGTMHIARAPPSLNLIIATATTTKTVAATRRFWESFFHFYNFHNKKKKHYSYSIQAFRILPFFISFHKIYRVSCFLSNSAVFLFVVSLILLKFPDTVIDSFLNEPIANAPQYQTTDCNGKVSYK